MMIRLWRWLCGWRRRKACDGYGDAGDFFTDCPVCSGKGIVAIAERDCSRGPVAVRTLRDDRDRLLAECERLRGELASRNRGTPIDEAIDRMKPGASDSVVDMLRAACDAFGGD